MRVARAQEIVFFNKIPVWLKVPKKRCYEPAGPHDVKSSPWTARMIWRSSCLKMLGTPRSCTKPILIKVVLYLLPAVCCGASTILVAERFSANVASVGVFWQELDEARR